MTATPESVSVKIERADQFITELDGAISRFWESRPYQVVAYLDEQRRPTYQIANIRPVDPTIPTIAGDTIQSLRTALDRMACALWTRTNAGDCKIYFPIMDDADLYLSEEPKKVRDSGRTRETPSEPSNHTAGEKGKRYGVCIA